MFFLFPFMRTLNFALRSLSSYFIRWCLCNTTFAVKIWLRRQMSSISKRRLCLFHFSSTFASAFVKMNDSPLRACEKTDFHYEYFIYWRIEEITNEIQLINKIFLRNKWQLWMIRLSGNSNNYQLDQQNLNCFAAIE